MKAKTICAVALGGAFASQAASAQTYVEEVDVDIDVDVRERPSRYSYAWYDPGLATGIGVGVHIGGGIGGFTSETMRNTVDSDISGLWGARVTIGTHIPIGLDIAYTGSAVDITPVGALETGTLIGTNVEGALRWNILPHYEWNPYIFAGIGWQRYDITDADFSTAATGLEDKDDLAVFPMGAGFSFRDMSGLVLDVRGTFRAADESNFFVTPDGNDVDLHTWEATAALGYEF